ncbi:MAG: NTP transferase domain-containing protein [Caulobacteraceae bacterium]|nr:NTP transferase domain-containing protein [Caulobacteraceae bacterium]
MAALSLVMPMAGRGSRFTREGRLTPKPLIELAGAPLFAWAVESVRRAGEVGEMVFVVLDEHVREHRIDETILRRYPEARLVVLDEVTSGAAETAALGVTELSGAGPFAVNDCDHAFRPRDLPTLVRGLEAGAAGALVGFASTSPAYSYVRLNPAGEVTATAEKQVIGPYAIAGCYLFARPAAFTARLERYRRGCPYPELFISGLYDAMAREGERVLFQPLARHVSFGTPEELARVRPQDLDFLAASLGVAEA